MNTHKDISFLLTLKVDNQLYGLDIGDVNFVASSANLQKNISAQTAFVGNFNVKNDTLAVFDLNFAISSVYAKRLFGTRLIISKVTLNNSQYSIALLSENVSKVVEIDSDKISKSEPFDTVDVGQKHIKIIDIEKLLGEVLLQNV